MTEMPIENGETGETEETRIHERQIKLFLAVPVAASVVRELGDVAESMRREAYNAGFEIRWGRPIGYHITVAFLGNTYPQVIGAIRDRLQPKIAALPRFSYGLRGFGAFPRTDNARVLWAGVHEPEGNLGELARTCSQELTELGFRFESRPYHPHVTVGRLKRPDDIRGVVEKRSERTFSKTSVEFVILFESVMKSGVLEYVERARFDLGTALLKPERHTEPLQPGLQGTREGPPETEQQTDSEGAPEPGEDNSSESAVDTVSND